MAQDSPTQQRSSQQVTQDTFEFHGKPNVTASDIVEYYHAVQVFKIPHEKYVITSKNDIHPWARKIVHWPATLQLRGRYMRNELDMPLLMPEYGTEEYAIQRGSLYHKIAPTEQLMQFKDFTLPLSVMTTEDSLAIRVWNFGFACASLASEQHKSKAIHVHDDIFNKVGVTREYSVNGICPSPAQPNGEASPPLACTFHQIRSDGETIVLLLINTRKYLLEADNDGLLKLTIKASLNELCMRRGLKALATMSAEEYGFATGIDIDKPLNKVLIEALHEARGGGQNELRWTTFGHVFGGVVPYARQLHGKAIKSVLRSVYVCKLENNDDNAEFVEEQRKRLGNGWKFNTARKEFYRDRVVDDDGEQYTADLAEAFLHRYVSLFSKPDVGTSREPTVNEKVCSK